MKKQRFPYALALFILAASCQTTTSSDDVVAENYVHRYGVPLNNASDWSERGRQGLVVSTRRDGVVVTKSYEAGVLEGETTYTFPHSDLIQKRETYDHNALTQETYFFANGIPQKQISYDPSGSKNITEWFDNGSPQSKEVYQDHKLVSGEYYNTSNQIESQVQDGNGVRAKRDSFGQLISMDDIRNGQMVASKTFHPNGMPASITPYENGEVHGKRRTFAMSGEPATVETWNRDVQHGNTVVYQNGEKYADAPYVNGKKQGVERRYRDGDILVQEAHWENGQQHGPCYSYFGNTKQIDWYFEGRQVNKATYDAMSNK